MTPKNRNRLTLIIAAVIAAGALAFVAFGNLGDNLVYYWSPSQLLDQGTAAYGKSVRLGGVVQKGSIHWDAGHTRLDFLVADDTKPESRTVKVSATETPPQMFREGIGVVVEGSYAASGVFSSKRLMVNHSNEYRPPKEGEGLKEMKETLSDAGETMRAK